MVTAWDASSRILINYRPLQVAVFLYFILSPMYQKPQLARACRAYLLDL
jgi:hypothetical protein